MNMRLLFVLFAVVGLLAFAQPDTAYAVGVDEVEGTGGEPVIGDDPAGITITTDGTNVSLASSLRILLILTILTLAPSILIMMTSFTRIIVVLHFTRAALATQSTPPNQVLIGLALFLTFFIMTPVFNEVNANAFGPLSRGEMSQQEAMDAGLQPISDFMYRQAKQQDVDLFMQIARREPLQEGEEVPFTVLVPAFILNELRQAFQIGFLIYLPFIVIDMVVSSTLMSMGMMMLPPTTISMPFKILLFIMADGWNLIIVRLVESFNL